ncbi:hypothetical protein OEB99_09925 [Actinotalea sp. M2MS4P-6]|uniref:hypothetical protein n=1 Tax=Actinotalea sp. M2MS4P-6 TaxID=2983762 RepID=UPI0021E3F3FF|nr:hypothetical protein [Actinotalea sp. M2MS4P-6]MCV2394624.1 hypothetical protein [Actinotalea sp. M2MS4P-6]
MSVPHPEHPDPLGHLGDEIDVPHLEVDENVPPRPEEEIADADAGTRAEVADPEA